MVSRRARILLALTGAAIVATGYAAVNGRVEKTANSLMQRIETGATTAARMIDDYGIYAARMANPLVGLEVLKESLTQLRDMTLPDHSQPPQCRGIADLHVHLPADMVSEDLEFLIGLAQERSVELIAVTSYPAGLIGNAGEGASNAGGYNIKPAIGAVSDAIKRAVPGISHGISRLHIDDVRPGGLPAIEYERFLELAEASPPYGVNRKGILSEITRNGEVVLRVLKAQEIWTETGSHIIVYGGRGRYQAGLPVEELARQASGDHPRLVGAAHPYLQGSPGRIGITVRKDAKKLAELLDEGLIDGIETSNPHSQAPFNVLARLMLRNSRNAAAIGTGGSDAHFFARSGREMATSIGLTGVVVNGAFDYSGGAEFIESARTALARNPNVQCMRYNDISGMVAMVDLQSLAERMAARNN